MQALVDNGSILPFTAFDMKCQQLPEGMVSLEYVYITTGQQETKNLL